MKDVLNKDFMLNPSTFVVEGKTRSMLIDLERSVYYLIPSVLGKILLDSKIKQIVDAIDLGNSEEEKETIQSYFEFLLEKNLIFFSKNLHLYKKIELKWDYPGQVSNAIIDLNPQKELDLKGILNQLASLLCRNVQFRSYEKLSVESVQKIMIAAEYSIIESIQIIMPYVDEKQTRDLTSLFEKYLRLRFVQLHGAPFSKIIFENHDQSAVMATIEEKITSDKCCGNISPEYFPVALSTFSEFQNFNSCLNKKISIDLDGEIKNCPSMPQSFGNINEITLKEALDHPEFKKYWKFSKDKIHVCKDCEFKYVCSDCRAFVEDPSDMNSKPLKCGYNPYTGEWSEWTTNPLKQMAIQSYKLLEV